MLVVAIAAGAAGITSRSIVDRVPKALLVSDQAALLYYNSPAAIYDSGKVHIGYIRQDGIVEVAAVNVSTGSIHKTFIHDYGAPDDHAAPALALNENGLLVATAFHSSSMFLYEITHAGDRVLRCGWSGRYSYPRFDREENQLFLYAREEDGAGGNLVKTAIDGETCLGFDVIAHAQRGIWLYASPPVAGQVVWSEYEQSRNIHSRAFLNSKSIDYEASDLPETLAWSTTGDLVALTHFAGAFECCASGSMITELYENEQLIYRSGSLHPPYYPDGIVINKSGREGFFPSTDYTFERRSIRLQNRLPGCRQDNGINARPQFIENGFGYVWTEFNMPYSGTNLLNSRVMLCLYQLYSN